MNQTSSRRILLLAPHQDDECLQTAGIIYQAAHSGAHVSVCFATNGEYASEADASQNCGKPKCTGRFRRPCGADLFLGISRYRYALRRKLSPPVI